MTDQSILLADGKPCAARSAEPVTSSSAARSASSASSRRMTRGLWQSAERCNERYPAVQASATAIISLSREAQTIVGRHPLARTRIARAYPRKWDSRPGVLASVKHADWRGFLNWSSTTNEYMALQRRVTGFGGVEDERQVCAFALPFSQSGLIARSFVTTVGTRSRAKATSSWLVCLPRLNRMEAWASSGARPIARST